MPGVFLLIATALFLPGGSARADNAPRRVVLLHSFSHAFSPWSDMATSFRSELIKRSPDPIDLYEISYDAARFHDLQDERAFIEYFRALLSGRNLDLIVPMGAPAAYFMQRNRSQLFPSTPILISGIDQQRVPDTTPRMNDTSVASEIHLSAYVENILRLRPQTKNIAVVIGKSPVEQYWRSQMREASQSFASRVNFTWFDDLPFDDMLMRAASLTPESVLFYYMIAEDAAGVPFSQDSALEALRAITTVPIFGFGDYQLGRGIVGGPLLQSQAMGQKTADIALRILKGENADDLEPATVGFGVPTYDWRELRRWRISESRLPAKSIILFRGPGVWESYRWQIMLFAAAFAAQTLLIAYGIAQYRRRRKAETSLIESKDQITFAAASANIGLWQFDRATDQLWASEHCRSMFGIATDLPLTRETFLATVHPEDRKIVGGALRGAMVKHQSTVTDARIVLPSGEVRWFRVRARSHHGEVGMSTKLSGIFADTTDQRTAKSEAELQRKEIAHLMRVSLLGELSGAIAHEINQPLTAILSNAQAALYLLGRDKPNLAEVEDALRDIVREDNRAGEVIQRLRGLLKKGESRSGPVDLNELIDSTTSLLRSELIERRVSVETDLAANLPMVLGDSVQLQQVLLNLVINAMDAMVSTPQAQRCIHISTRETTAGAIEVLVKDEGTGMQPAGGQQAFEPFFTTKEHGLGLGLTICSTIIRQHGGTINLRNNDTGGAVAEFLLPAHVMLMAAQ
jgi:signal transduction histidine kinase/ABC-type uncharacterized transport system substrate-binding protein